MEILLLILGAAIISKLAGNKKEAETVESQSGGGNLGGSTSGGGAYVTGSEVELGNLDAVSTGGNTTASVNNGGGTLTVIDDRQFVTVSYNGQKLSVPILYADRVRMADELLQAANELALKMQNGEIPRDNDKVREIVNKAQFIRSLTDQRMAQMSEAGGGTGTGTSANGLEIDNGALSWSGKPNLRRIQERRRKRPKIVSGLNY